MGNQISSRSNILIANNKMMFLKFLSLMFLFAMLSPDNVTGCGTINNCFGEGCHVGCKVECHNNCKQECEGEGWRRHGRWDDEEECVNDCDATCTRNCNKNNRILGIGSGMDLMTGIMAKLGSFLGLGFGRQM